ncbi:glycosyltransferase family 2 protein [Clostridium sp. CT7]|uniref:glycosyltransferase n=1 Tax=Clostridium sp. CT7 TaxID=2052574 RepID=UPI0008259CCC|nr:glycosyltransferase [Clostridium sp. CT7]PJI09697.1 glycosyltransferase family 2 protein [Clostridium sp. CT7]
MKDDPLVSILIPTFNRPELFNMALMSAVNQTYKNIEIVICDDSTNYYTKKIVDKYLKKYKNIRYYFNNGPLGNFGLNNFNKCYELSRGEYINYLNDDDMFVKNKVLKMLKCFKSNNKISLVTSHRELVDRSGDRLPHTLTYNKIKYVNRPINGRRAAKAIFLYGNFIGEPTTVLFKKKDVDKFGTINNRQFCALIDIATWIKLLLRGNFVYLSETLSCFRIHNGQNTNKPGIKKLMRSEWYELIQYAYKMKIIDKSIYSQLLLSYK